MHRSNAVDRFFGYAGAHFRLKRHAKNSDSGSESGIEQSSVVAQEKGFDEEQMHSSSDNVSTIKVEEVDASAGVKKAEAVAMVWPMWAVYCTYAWIFITFFAMSIQMIIGSYSSYYAYQDFAASPLISTASILGTIIGGPAKLVAGKLVNIWGRAEGLVVFFMFYLVGIIVLASSHGPSSYAAGYVLYWIGYDTLYNILEIYISDTAGMKNRAFAFGFVQTPFICTTFTGSLAVNSFLKNSTWRWAYGCFAIVMPFVFAPLVIVFHMFEKKAAKQGLFVKPKYNRTMWQSIKHYFWEFDIIGGFLLVASFVIFLLPFSLCQNGSSEYKSATFIAMVIIGVLLFPVFCLYDKYLAPVPFISWKLLSNRTIFGACVLSAVVQLCFYCWDLYWYYGLQVVYDLNVTDTNYMMAIYTVGSCVFSPIFGIYVRVTKHFKYACLLFGVPLMILGTGLLIKFHSGTQELNYVIMSQIFIAFSGGVLVIGDQMAGMAASDHEGVAMILSLLSLFSSVGGALGNTIAAAIHSNVLTRNLEEYLPDELKADYLKIYANTAIQTAYPVGSAARDAVIRAWTETQKWEFVAAVVVMSLAIPSVMMWRNYSVDTDQNKGKVL